MALQPPYSNYQYLNRFGQNRHTIEYLTSALYSKGTRLAKDTPIPLPKYGGVVETIPAYLAYDFIIDWVSNENYITSQELDFFNKNIFKSPESTLARIFTLIQKRVVEPEHLLTDRLVANVAALEESRKITPVGTNSKFDPIEAIKKYNQEKLSLQLAIATQQRTLKELVPTQLTADNNGKITPQTVTELISSNFESLQHVYVTSVSKYEDIKDNQERARLIGQSLHSELAQFVAIQNPSHIGFLTQSYNNKDFVELAMLVGTTIEKYEKNGGNFETLYKLKSHASEALPTLLPTQSEIYDQIKKSINSQDASKLAEEIIRELNRSAQEGLTGSELIKKVSAKTNLNESQINDLILKLSDTPILAALDYELHKTQMTQNQIGISLVDRQLKSQGINPTLLSYDLTRELKRKGIKGQSYEQRKIEIETRLSGARSSGNIQEIEELSSLLTHAFYDHIATRSEKGLSNLSHLNNRINSWRGKVEEAEMAFFDKWHHFEENLPWNKAFRAVTDKVEELEHTANLAIYKLQDKLHLSRFPIFGVFGHIAEKWELYKIAQTAKTFKWVSTWNSPGGRKLAKWFIRQYRFGNYTISGGIFSGFRSATGSAYKWALTKATSTAAWQKAAAWGSKAFGATLKTISAKLGTTLAGIALSAATVVGTTIAIVGLAATAFDFIIKPLLNFFQRFFSDPGFAALSVAIGGAFATIATIPSLLGAGILGLIAGLGGALAGLAALFTTAFFWAIGITMVVVLLFKTFDVTTNLDPGDPEAIARALAGTEGSKNINLVKEVTGSFNGEKIINNSNINQTLTYTITITATNVDLTDVTIKDQPTLITKSGSRSVGESISESIPLLKHGETKTITYDLKLDSSFRDSYLSNTVTVEAQSEEGQEDKAYTINISVGTPPTLPTAAFAERLAQAINACYGTKVTIPDDGACLAALNDPQINSKVISILAYSADRYSYLQCVGFIQAVAQGVYGSFPTAGNAADYLTNVPAGYTLYQGTPTVGDIFVMGYDQVSGTGHIGIVTGVAGSLITVADANSNGYGFARERGQIELTRISGFLRKK